MNDVTRVLALDLETSNLKGNFGHILVGCAKWVGDKDFALSRRIDQSKGFGKTPASYCNDKAIVSDLVDLINESQAIVAHYGERFDVPFLVTRCLVNGIKPPAPVKVIDTWKYAYKRLALTSNRLETVSHALGCETTKYKLPMEAWQLADHGDKKKLEEMQAYCENDVNTLIDVYLKLLPVIHDHPNVTGARGACPACVKTPVRLQARGYQLSRVFRTQRFQCQNCGTWFKGKQERI